MRTLQQSRLLAAALLLTACASAGGPAIDSFAADRPVRLAPARSARDPITAGEIESIQAASAYDAVVKLRSGFLQARGVNSVMAPVRSTRPVVFVDGMEMGTIFELRSIPARDVLEIRFLSGADAMIRYGDGYMAGIIHVTTKR